MKWLKTVGIGIFLLTVALWFGQSHAAAASWCGVLAPAVQQSSPPSNYDCLNFGQDYTTCTVLSGTFPNCGGSNLKTEFINRMHNLEQSNQPFQKVGAQTIEARLYKYSDVSWETRLGMADVTLDIENFTFQKNSAYDPSNNTDITYDDPLSHKALVFRVVGNPTAYFAIKLDCGNFEGTLPGLPKAEHWTLNSTSKVWTTTINAWSPFGQNENAAKTDSIKFQHNLSNDSGSANTADTKWKIEGCYAKVGVTCSFSSFSQSDTGGMGGTLPAGSDASVPPGANASGLPLTTNYNFPSNAGVGDRYCQLVAYTNANGPDTTTNYGGHSDASCAVLQKPGAPTGTIACSNSTGPWIVQAVPDSNSKLINDPDKTQAYNVDVYMDGSTKIVSRATTSSLGAYSTNVDAYVPANSSHTFYVYIYGVNTSGAEDGVNGKTNTVTCGAPVVSGNCGGVSLSQNVTLPDGASPAPAGSSSGSTAPGATDQSGMYYYQEVPGNQTIKDAYDQYTNPTHVGWSPSGSQPKQTTFTLDYTNYKNDYGYDDHSTTVVYDQAYSQTVYQAHSSADFYTCNPGDPAPTAPNGQNGHPATCTNTYPAASSGGGTNTYNICGSAIYSGGYCWTYVGPYDAGGPPPNRCSAGHFSFNGACYNRNAAGSCSSGYTGPDSSGICSQTIPITYSCNSGDPPPNSSHYCTHTYAGKPWYFFSSLGNSTINSPNNTYAAPFFPECYDRTFNIQSVGVNVGLDDYEDPSSGSSSANVSVTFGYQPGIPALGFRVAAKVTLNYSSSGCSGGAGGSTTVNGGNQPGTFSTTVPGGSCSATVPPLHAGDSVCATYTFSPDGTQMKNDGTITVASSGSVSGSGCSAPISNLPYAHFWGLDVSAGGSFETGSNQCTTAVGQQSGIKAFIKGTGPLTRGSGTQFGALALGSVDTSVLSAGFGSASLRSSIPTARDGLTFANKGTLGNMGLSNHCVPDYFATNPITTPDTSGTTISLSTFNSAGNGKPTQLYYGDGSVNYTVDGFSGFGTGIENKNNIAIYVNGDVYIQNDIRFRNTTWTATTDIPSFYLIVKGNIFVAPSVHQLDGVYVAQPDSGGGGTINTCANGFQRFGNADLFNNCSSQLKINGAFIAQNVELNRTYASLRSSLGGEYPYTPAPDCTLLGDKPPSPRAATNFDCAAEIFDFSPETYLGVPGIPATSDQNSGRFDYITSLSPVL